MNANKIIAEAQKLMCNQDFWDKVNNVELSKHNGKKSITYEDGVFDRLTPQQLQESKQPKFKKTGNPVLDSFIDKPPIQIDAMSLELDESISAQPISQTQTAQPYINNNSIDYNYIKYLIDESIKAHLSNNQLNESKTTQMVGMRMCDGNKIQFLDNRGNLYEGVLKLKKRKQ